MFKSANSNNYRISVAMIRMLMNIAIASSIFYDFGFIDVLCGPMAVPSNPDLFIYIVLIEIVNCHYWLIIKVLSSFSKKWIAEKLANSYFIKYLIILVLKLMLIIIRSEHRSRYYAHSIFIEFILLVTILMFDLVNNKNILEVVELTITDMTHKVSLLYLVTRTFCPKFCLYWFVSNLIYVILSQIESYLIKNSHQQQFSTSLYVKQDIHRFLIFAIIYFGIFSTFQTTIFGYGFFIIFLVTLVPFYKAIVKFDKDSLVQSLIWLLLVCFGIIGLIMARIWVPSLFRPLFLTPTCTNNVGIYIQD